MSWMTPDRPKQIIIKHYKPQHPLLQAEIGILWKRAAREHTNRGKGRKKRNAMDGTGGKNAKNSIAVFAQQHLIFEKLIKLTTIFAPFYYWTYIKNAAAKFDHPQTLTVLEGENLPQCLNHSLCNRKIERHHYCVHQDQTKYKKTQIQETLNVLLQTEKATGNTFKRLWAEEKNSLSKYIKNVWAIKNKNKKVKVKEKMADAIKNLIGENGIQNKIDDFEQRGTKWGYWFNCEHFFRQQFPLTPENLDKWISEAFGIDTAQKIERKKSKKKELDCDVKCIEIEKEMVGVLSKISKIKQYSNATKQRIRDKYLTTNTYFVGAYVAISKFKRTKRTKNITQNDVRHFIFDRLARFIGISNETDARDESVTKFSKALYKAFIKAAETGTLTLDPKSLFSEEKIKNIVEAAAAAVHKNKIGKSKKWRKSKKK